MRTNKDRLKIARVVTSPANCMSSRNLMTALSRSPGVDFHLMVSPGLGIDELDVGELIRLSMRRGLSPFQDVMTVFRLFRVLRRGRYDVIHSHTLKAGLISSIAGLLARVPVRIHTYTDQRWEGLSGFKGRLAGTLERFIYVLNTDSLTDSQAQVRSLCDASIGTPAHIRCLGDGSLAGVDTGRFNSNLKDIEGDNTRHTLGIPLDHVVYLFVGSIARDKGVNELVQAFEELCGVQEHISMILLGSSDPEMDPIDPETVETIRRNQRIHRVQYSPNPEMLMSASDVLVLPSYKEGFPTVVLESAAMGLCSIVTDFSGVEEVVLRDETGLIVPPKDTQALQHAMAELLQNSDKRAQLGVAARTRAQEHFNLERMVELYLQMYRYYISR